MKDATAAIKGIRRAAKARDRADIAKAKATEELRSYCKAAQEAGVPVTQIASKAGLSRQGVYDLLTERTSS
jgi:DNA-binding phage protein